VAGLVCGPVTLPDLGAWTFRTRDFAVLHRGTRPNKTSNGNKRVKDVERQ
jgi:hypothetical protein